MFSTRLTAFFSMMFIFALLLGFASDASAQTASDCQTQGQQAYDACVRARPLTNAESLLCQEERAACEQDPDVGPLLRDNCADVFRACTERPSEAPVTPDQERVCAQKAEEARTSCLREIESKGNVSGRDPGCYCFQNPINGNLNESGSKKRIQTFNTPSKCADIDFDDGYRYTQCEWVGPDPEAKPISEEDALFSAALKEKISGLNQVGNATPQDLIGRVIRTAMGVAGSIALIILIYSGILWMTAAGNASRENEAKDIMIWGAVGILIILGSYAIVTFIIENAFIL